MAEISGVFHNTPSLSSFEICHSGSCAESNQVSLSDVQWRKVSSIFTNKAQNAQQERAQIAQAIAVLETIIVKKLPHRLIWQGIFRSLAIFLLTALFNKHIQIKPPATNNPYYLANRIFCDRIRLTKF